LGNLGDDKIVGGGGFGKFLEKNVGRLKKKTKKKLDKLQYKEKQQLFFDCRFEFCLSASGARRLRD